MSINPLLTNYGPNASLYAPAGSGGGGGGGSNYPANAVFSSITTGLAQVSTIQSGAAPMLLDGQGNAITIAASAVNIPGAPTNISTLVVSSINGAAPGGGGSVGPNLTVSTLIAATYIDAPASSGSLRLEEDGSTGSHLVYISSGINTTIMKFSPTAITANNGDFIVSSINSISYPPPPSESTVTTFNGTQMPGGFQCGYADNVPYTGIITFPYPYPNDKVSVVLTPTNAGVSGGANPNLSLGAGYGTNGVSSVGFQTDFRNTGIGATGNFFWMAFPWTN